MVDDHRIEIAGETYIVTVFGAKKADTILDRIGLPVVAGIINALFASDASNMLQLVQGAVQALKPGELPWLRDQLFEQVKVVIKNRDTGQELQAVPLLSVYDEHFRLKNAAKLELLARCLQLNFSDFLGESVVTNIRAVLGAVKLVSTVGGRNTSAGSSGASSSPPTSAIPGTS